MSNERKTRRQAIKTIFHTAAAVGIPLLLEPNLPPIDLGRKKGRAEGLDIAMPETQEEAIIFNEIRTFRQKLGLEGLSKELIKASANRKAEWGVEPVEFFNGFHELMKSYGLATQEEAQKILGRNSDRVITGAELSTEPYGHYYDPEKRRINLARDADLNYSLLKKDGPGWNYYHLVAHEVGHNLDPRYISDILPWQILLKVEHAKWMMLSEAFTLTGGEAETVKGKLSSALKINLGSAVAEKFVEGSLEQSLENSREIGLVDQAIDQLAKRWGKSKEELKFNKRISRQCGDQLLRMIGSGQLHLKGELKGVYDWQVNGALIEVFAEMFRVALMRPEGINNNPQVVEGTKNIISAIRGEDVDLADLRSKLFELSPEVTERYEYERSTKKTVKEYKVLSGYESQVQNQEQELDNQDKIYDDFLRGGRLPDNLILPPNQIELLQSYAGVLSKFIMGELKLRDSRVPLNYVLENFDPDMHLWEIRKIEHAVLNINIRSLLDNLTKKRQVTLNPDQIKQIGEHTLVLENFMDSQSKAA